MALYCSMFAGKILYLLTVDMLCLLLSALSAIPPSKKQSLTFKQKKAKIHCAEYNIATS